MEGRSTPAWHWKTTDPVVDLAVLDPVEDLAVLDPVVPNDEAGALGGEEACSSLRMSAIRGGQVWTTTKPEPKTYMQYVEYGL